MVPRPGALSTVTKPPDCFTAPCTYDSPSPTPCPGSFVVKNGSKMRATTSRAIPVPVSLTDSLEYDPRRAFAQVVLDASAPVNLHFSPRRQVARTSDDIPDDDDRAGAQECGGGAP